MTQTTHSPTAAPTQEQQAGHISQNSVRFMTMVAAAMLFVSVLFGGCGIIPGTTTSTGTYGTSSYTIPSWAPTSENLSQVRYYYFPDMNLFYDGSTGQYMSMNSNGAWTASYSVPSQLASTDLNHSFVVLLGPNTSTPWNNYTYYQTNYPSYSYQPYSGIVTSNGMIQNLPTGYSVAPRAYNEATNQVVFQQRDQNGNYVTGVTAYSDVPMTSISTYMPSNTQNYNYGGGMRQR